MKITRAEVEIPAMEVMAAFQISRNQAERDGYPRIMKQVQGYIDALNEIMNTPGLRYGTWKVVVEKKED